MLKRVAIFTLLVCMSFSFELWTNQRLLPVITPIEGMPFLDYPFDLILLAILAILFVVNVIFVRHRFSSYTLIAVMALLFVVDMNRWQPWYWHFLWLLIAILPFSEYYNKYRKREHLIHGIQLAFVSIYFWGGVFKLNPAFGEKIVPYLSYPIADQLVTFRPWIHNLVKTTPYFEILLAFGLLWKRTRLVSVTFAVVMHLSVILLFSPLGLNANLMVIPWNFGLLLGVIVLFFGYKENSFKLLLDKSPGLIQLSLLVLFVLPVLNFGGWYNKSLAFEMYSGTNFTRDLGYPENWVKRIPTEYEPYTYSFGDSIYIKTYELTIHRYRTPPNPDKWVWKRTYEEVLKKLQ